MYKQIILVRQDLQLPKGKLAAQVAHAAVESFVRANKEAQASWRAEGQMKIVVKVPDDKALFLYLQMAKDVNIPHALITDAGKTVIAPGTVTVLGIGPAEEKDIDSITSELKLL